MALRKCSSGMEKENNKEQYQQHEEMELNKVVNKTFIELNEKREQEEEKM